MEAQVFSEAPVTISDKGERLSTMIYVKVKSSGYVEIPEGYKYVDANSISNKFSNIRTILHDFCKSLQITLSELRISKAIPNAKEEDTLFIDNKTGEIKKLPNLARVFIIKFPQQVNIETIISELEKSEEVEYAHGPVQLVDCAEYPNDYYFSNGGQWYLNAIKAPEAWGITKGSSDIKIALIEKSGVEFSHSDLRNKIVGGDNNPGGIGGGHGTWVAGFAGAETNNNSLGVASLGWNIKLLTFQPYNDDDQRSVLAQKITDAVDAGASVINMSFRTVKNGFSSCDQSLLKGGAYESSELFYYYNWNYGLVSNAIQYAIGHNVVIIASAGNFAEEISGERPCELVPFPSYPAKYSGVIAVSGSMQNNNFVDGWNYGSFVDVNAPGKTDASTGLWSTDLNNSYTNSVSKTSGTSFAAPQVSALSALIKSLDVTLSPATVGSILINSADKIGQYSYDANGWNQYMGYGRINAYNALLLTHAYSTNNPKSISQTATANNGQRKVVKDGSGNFHTVFSSGGEIFYRRQNASGSWQDPVKISFDNGLNDAPSIEAGQTNHIAITWQRQTATNTYDIYFARSTDQGSTWPQKYILTSSVSSSLIPYPVLAIDKTTNFYTVLYNTSTALKNKTATNPSGIGNWSSETSLPGSTSSDYRPSLSTGSSTIILCTYQNNNQIYYRYQNANGSWSSAENIMSNIPGSSHQTPTITGIPSSNQVHVAWQGITSIGKSVIYHRKKDTYNGSWPSEYYTTYYEGQQLPSLSGLATNKVDLLFQTIPSFANSTYKMRFNGSTWSTPTLVASNAVYPSVSIGSTTAKYVYTSGITSPYTVTLSGETLSKESAFNPSVYSRSIAIMNNPEEYLEVVLNKMYFKMKDGSTQRIDFLPVDLEELKIKEKFDLTTSNAWDLMKGIKDLTIPVGADELVFDYTVRGENIDKVIEGNITDVDLSFGLNVTTKNEKAEKVKSVILNNGKITETKFQEIIPLSSLTAERGFDKIDLGLKVKGIVPKSTAFASLGHIFDFTNITAANGTQANKADNTDGIISEELTTQNYPNPFNPTTLIQFTIKNSGKVTLKVYDVLGREVANLLNSYHESGSYEIPFDGSSLPSGIYFYNLTVNGKSLTKKMMLLK
ncbi:MAG: S8 family serine peptidase [Bacteroidota bacterium]